MAAIKANGNILSLSSITPSQDARFTNHIYVRGKGHMDVDKKRQLEGLGVTFHEYLGDDTYLCRYEPSDLSPIRNLTFVDVANTYHRRLKTTPSLEEAVGASSSDAAAGDGKHEVDVLLHKGEHNDLDKVVAQLAEKTGISVDDMSASHNQIRLTVDGASIAKIEELDAVKAIQQVVPKKLFNNVARDDLEIPEPVEGDETIFGLKYQGQGQVVAIADTGFDKGSKTDTHPAFKNRVVALYPVGRPGKTNDPHGHGTHCAGSVLGDGKSRNMGVEIKGTAPKASLVMQSLIVAGSSGGLATPENLWNLFINPYQNDKARVASNSWGPDWEAAGSKQLPYDTDANDIDRFVFANPDHVIVFAAGNDGREPVAAQIGGSSAAKNAIIVGATESTRPSTSARYDPKKKTPGQPNKLADFSSRGPTLEGRIKPDVVAPGVAILSASSRDDAVTDAMRDQFGPSSDRLWMFCSGTSMATPLVAGCCAVLRQAVMAKAPGSPSAALIKALLVNGATDLSLPREQQGFGRVDVTASLVSVEGNGINGFADVTAPADALAEGTPWTREVSLPAGSDRKGIFKVTLAYSDPNGPELQNNLTLKVQVRRGGIVVAEKKGNEGFKKENNVEKVVLADFKAGDTAVITVMAERIVVPGKKQPLAVAWALY